MKAKMSILAGMVVLFVLAITTYIVPSQIISSANSSVESESNVDDRSSIAKDSNMENASKAVVTQRTHTAHTRINQLEPAEAAVLAATKQEANVTQVSVAKESKSRLNEASAETPAKSDLQTSKKTVYLTFDDGPGKHTSEVLDILESYEVPATFFVLGKYVETYPELVYRMHEEGHAIGNHTYNHDYDELYDNFPDFWSQIKTTEEAIRLITGSRPQLVRAPGGTFGHFDQNYFDLMKQAGYSVVDWNVDSGDSKRSGVPAAEIAQQATEVSTDKDLVILLHDGGNHAETVKALPEIIEYYQKHQYHFAVLDPAKKPVQFRVKNEESTKKRFQPSSKWINNVIAPNAELFEEGPSLVIEAGKQMAELNYGEYRLQNGQYIVPLRDVIEKFGGSVKWNAAERSAELVFGQNAITVRPDDQLVTASAEGYAAEADIYMENGVTWLPLRTLLNAANFEVKSLTHRTGEVVVYAM
ncbi:polysaccharide deacetylase family protein [Paenibacillus provencensis]|uniref:Polysaccharide deacetylase family protein n=1 Tax=Paenibacillus provencensis TaxID=441151 RepID=A0ABW3Q1P6_9BACL|nr:polysaccharide deacetylase [Paenibacillus sp. MER 78]MCM3129505.1 polysaccharide deacetylase [Paenibacillus sp. MER 78]